MALGFCTELSIIVNNVLDTIQIGCNGEPLAVEQISVAQVVHEVLDQAGGFGQQSCRTCIDIDENIHALANVQCLRHILHNLLSNAYKYTSPPTPVTVNAQRWQTDDGSRLVCMSVIDQGLGIPEQEMPLLFNQFVRLQRDLAGTIRGSGLGLYISKQLVEAMGGHIWVESTGVAGEGSRFCFTLPCCPTSSSDPHTEPELLAAAPVKHQ